MTPPAAPATLAATEPAKASPPIGGWARHFGYDIFISFALGPAPRGSRAYASDLARRLRERGFTVFFSEDEAAVGDELDATLRRALRASRVLVVVANRGTLAEPRWVRTEVEEYRRRRPRGSIVPISIDGAVQDPQLGPASQPWLQHGGRIWIDESAEAGDSGRVSDAVVERLVTAPHAVRSLVRLRAALAALFMLILGLALWALGERNLAAEQRDQAQRSLLASASQQALLLARDGRAREGWQALVQALATAQPQVDGALPEGFLEAALTTLVEDRRGPDLRFDERATPPPLREAGDIQPPALAFAADGRSLAAAAGRHVALWSSEDGRRLLQVRLDFEPERLTFNKSGTLLVAEGRAPAAAAVPASSASSASAASAPDDRHGGPPRAEAIALPSGERLTLPLRLCQRWLPCIGPEGEGQRLRPLAELPALAELRAGRWPAGLAFLADRADGTSHAGVSQGRFHLLLRETPPDDAQWWLVDAQTGGALQVKLNLDERPEGVAESANQLVLASEAPFLLAGARNSPWMRRYRIEPGQPQPSLRASGAVRAPQAAATQNQALNAQGTQLRYQTWRFGTGPGVGVGRTAVVDIDSGLERWSRGEGEVVWGDALVALQEDWGQTQVLDAATGAAWFSMPGRPLAFDPSGRRLLMWDMRRLDATAPAATDWPALRLVEALPLRQFARDARGPASQRSACMDLRDLRFLTLAERSDRVWNRDDFHRLQAVAPAASPAASQAAPDSGTLERLSRGPAGWVLEGEDAKSGTRLDGAAFARRYPELAELANPAAAAGAPGIAALSVRDSADGRWRVALLEAAEGPGALRARCPGGAAWQLHRRGSAQPQQQGCSSLDTMGPEDLTLPQFVPGPPGQADALLLAAPSTSCAYALIEPASGRGLGQLTPVFGANVRFERLSPDLLGVASSDWYGATLSYQWQVLGSSTLGPVFMLADRNQGDDEADASAASPSAAAAASAASSVAAASATRAAGPAAAPMPEPMPSLVAQDAAATAEDTQSWTLEATAQELRVTAQGQRSRVAVPPWGERLRAKLRQAVRERQAASRATP